jgi:hypothetical protein
LKNGYRAEAFHIYHKSLDYLVIPNWHIANICADKIGERNLVNKYGNYGMFLIMGLVVTWLKE